MWHVIGLPVVRVREEPTANSEAGTCGVQFDHATPPVSLNSRNLIFLPNLARAGISFVFFLVGLCIKLGDLAGAALNFRLNLLTQVFSLGALPAAGLGLSRVLAAGGMHPALADGVLVLMALPTTVNMCVILTQSAEGVCVRARSRRAVDLAQRGYVRSTALTDLSFLLQQQSFAWTRIRGNVVHTV